jgi:hypothetical protein
MKSFHSQLSHQGSLSFRPRKCKTLIYQRSFFIRVIRTYNSLPESLRQKDLSLVRFRKLLLDYYHNAAKTSYDVDDARTWRTVCLKCNTSRKLMQPLQLISYNFSLNIAYFVPNFVVKFKSSY